MSVEYERLPKLSEVPSYFVDKWDPVCQARVGRGARHFDNVQPDWYTKVDPSTLCMYDADHWIAAQVAGQVFFRAEYTLDIRAVGDVRGGFVSDPECIDPGKLCNDIEQDRYYALLQEHWLRAVEERMRQDTAKHNPEQVVMQED